MSTAALPDHRPGHRDAVLCIHASATSARSWRPLMAPLAESFELLMPDRLGYAEGECWDATRAASFSAEARHLAPLLADHRDGVHVVAHSFGAAVALELALRWPARVKSLTLYEPTRFALLIGPADTVESGEQILRIAHKVARLVLVGRDAEAAAAFVDYWSGPGTWPGIDPRRQQAVGRHMPKVCAEFEAAFADRTPLVAYRRLSMPVCLMSGDTSPAPAQRITEQLMSRLPNARHERLHGVGHMGPVSHPQQVFDRLPPWLAVPQAMAA